MCVSVMFGSNFSLRGNVWQEQNCWGPTQWQLQTTESLTLILTSSWLLQGQTRSKEEFAQLHESTFENFDVCFCKEKQFTYRDSHLPQTYYFGHVTQEQGHHQYKSGDLGVNLGLMQDGPLFSVGSSIIISEL